MALSKGQWIMIVVGILIIVGLVLVYYFALQPKPKVLASGAVSPDTCDSLGNVYLNGIWVGVDNGNNTWTSSTGAIYDYSNNVITPAPAPGSTVTTTSASGTTTTAPATAPTGPNYNLFSMVSSPATPAAPALTPAQQQAQVNQIFAGINI